MELLDQRAMGLRGVSDVLLKFFGEAFGAVDVVVSFIDCDLPGDTVPIVYFDKRVVGFEKKSPLLLVLVYIFAVWLAK